ncbi:MAG: Cell-shape determining protein [Microgenomates group bacterium GW2011_GWA2_44_7]|nr:MAG: Cell-shape determining protein [Microgenomates group bacterium GW2011_GWA2_44_7]
MAGNKLDESIANFLRRKHNLIIGDQTAEDIKIKIGSAMPLHPIEKFEAKGRDSVVGLPRVIEITSADVYEAIRGTLLQIIAVVKGVLEETPPELISDIIDKGIVMSGGTALTRNFDQLMTAETGVPCHVADEPLLCVVRGTGIAMENIDLYKKSITKR